tara:strand:- start:556 stop:756 length:201 start_codon:yes stop_codon:yes gene_type:complete
MDANKLAKRKADKNIKLQWVRRHFELSNDVGKASKKKSQAKQVIRQRILCEHLRNPEETFSFNNDN